jgi:hypothetical protein
MYLGSQSFFFFGLSIAHFLVFRWCHFWRRSAPCHFGKKKQKEDMRRAHCESAAFVFKLCCSRAKRRDFVYHHKRLWWKKGSGVVFVVDTLYIERTIYHLRFTADIPLLFFLLFLGNDDYDDDGVDESASFSLSSFTRLLCWSRGDSTDDDGKDAVITTQKQV